MRTLVNSPVLSTVKPKDEYQAIGTGPEGRGKGLSGGKRTNLDVVKAYLYAPVRTIKCPIDKVLSYLRGAGVPKPIKKE